jgi:5-methylphenazine-1-carboxylate 1-monooxygenase
MRILIAGAGIGGLTAALCLHQAGIGVEVVEASRFFEPLGVGINLLPDAVTELTRLGLGPDLAAIGRPVAEMAHFDRHGNPIWRQRRDGQYSLHRGELHMLLLRAVRSTLGPEAVRFGAAIQDFAADTSGVTAVCRDQITLQADALIGADGLHSTVRRRLYPAEGPPVASGITMWRGISPSGPLLAGGTVAVYGSNSTTKLVVYPISPSGTDGARLNWVAEARCPAPSARSAAQIRTAVISHFADWSVPGLDLPRLFTTAPEILQLPMTDRDPLNRWGHGPVTLLGDAAHPMYPVGSNGASQAILDARALATALMAARGPEAALREYEAQRLPVTNAIVEACRAMPADAILALVAARAPEGFSDIGGVLTSTELAAITAAYRGTSAVSGQVGDRIA